MAQIVIGESENGRNLTVALGDEVRIVLPENPTTGFRWQLTAGNQGVLRLQSDDFLPGLPAAAGSGGMRTFRLIATARGNTHIRLELKRAWEALAPRSAFVVQLSVS